MSERLNTQYLIDLIINRQGLERDDAEALVKAFFALIQEGLERDGLVKIKGLGTFKLVQVGSRESINVNTGERIEIQGYTKIGFTPDSTLRETINKPFAHFETVIVKNESLLENTVEEPEETDELNEVMEEPLETTESDNDTKSIALEETGMHDVKEEQQTQEIKSDIEPEVEIPPVALDEKSDDERITFSEEGKEEHEAENSVNPPGDEPPISEDGTEEDMKEEERSSGIRVLTILVFLTILLCGGLLIYLYFPEIFPHTEKRSVSVEHAQDSIVAKIESDTMQTIQPIPEEPQAPVPEKEVEKTNVVMETSHSSTVPFSQIPVHADSTSYNIIGTKTLHTIAVGETLIRISYKYYGTKDLWPYILEHNRAKIRNSNILPVGEEIKIPELKKK